jgi:transcriptional regulator with PAS, ATPase and Fis domain
MKKDLPHFPIFPTHMMDVDLLELKERYKKIWHHFSNQDLQKLLGAMTSSFFFEYFEITKKNNWTFEAIWNLKQKYLFNVYESIKSPQKMGQQKRTAKSNNAKRFDDVQAPYPSLRKIISHDEDMIEIKRKIITICNSNAIDRFLLFGETGTGKELFARAIHEISRGNGVFIPVNCASIPDNMFETEFFGHKKGSFTDAKADKSGYFDQANGGTIFLDEIGELHKKFQARFLRVLQEKEFTPVGGKLKKVDFMLISATNRDFEKMIEDGTFREDLYHRINDYSISLPSLSERKEDIPLLAQHFMKKYDSALHDNPSLEPLVIEDDALNELEKYPWRGNIRELEKVCKLVLAFRNKDDRSDIKASEFNLAPAPDSQASKRQRLSKHQLPLKKEKVGPGNTQITDEQVIEAMKNNDNNKTKAGKELGVTYHTILRRCKKLGI